MGGTILDRSSDPSV